MPYPFNPRQLVLLILSQALVWQARGAYPECSWLTSECLFTYNPRFGELMQEYDAGNYDVIMHVPENQRVFCDIENWEKRSEICGPCPYTFEFSSGVPEEHLGVQICLTVSRKTESGAEDVMMHSTHRHNGLKMPVVLDPAEDGDDLTDTIALVTRGLAKAGQWRRNNTLIIGGKWSYFWHGTAELSPQLEEDFVGGQGIESAVTFSLERKAMHLHVFEVAEANPGAEGVVRFHCGGTSVRSNPDANLGQYGGGSCPMDSPMPELCATHSDVSGRLCADCPVMMYDAVTDAPLGCLWEPALLPQRSYNNMADVMTFNLTERVVFIDANRFLRSLINWEPWKGKIVVVTSHKVMLFVTGPQLATLATQAGVKALITAVGSNRLRGWVEEVRVPLASMHDPVDVLRLREWMVKQPKKVESTGHEVYEAEVTFTRPPRKVWEVTPAPPVEVSPTLHVEEDTKSLFGEPAAVAGTVLLPLLLPGLFAIVWHLQATVMPTRAARGVPLSVGSTLLSLSLGVVLTAVTYTLAVDAGREAEGTQRRNKEDVVRLLNMRDEETKMTLAVEYLSKSAQSFFHRADMLQEKLRSEGEFYRVASAFGYDSPTYQNWEYRQQVFRQLKGKINKVGIHVQVMMREGFYYDDFTIENHAVRASWLSPLKAKLPLMESLAVRWLGFYVVIFVESYTPYRWLFWHDLPSQYANVHEYDGAGEQGGSVTGRLYTSYYQVMPPTVRWSLPTLEQIESPFMTLALAVRELGGLVTVSMELKEASFYISQSFSTESLTSHLGQSMTYVWFREDGLIVSSNIGRFPQWHVLDSFRKSAGLQQYSFQCFNIFDSLQWELNAAGNFLMDQYGRLDAKDPGGKGVLTRNFAPHEYLKEYRTEAMWLTFDGTAADSSWHVWDTWAVCRHAPPCVRYIEGRHGQAMLFDGTAEVLVSPYLSMRVPRLGVLPGTGTADYYYNESRPLGGVPDVVVTRAHRLSHADWEPVQREWLFRAGREYSVSAWVRRDSVASRGIVIADSLGLDANMQLYSDGQLVVSRRTYGCRTAALEGLPVGKWFFLVATMRFPRSWITGQCAVYVDGTRRAMSLPSRPVRLDVVSRKNMTIGRDFVGALDDLRVHNRTLSAAAVVQLMGTGDARVLPDPSEYLALAMVTDDLKRHEGNPTYSYAVIASHSAILRGVREQQVVISELLVQQNYNTERQLDRKVAATLIIVVALLLTSVLAFTAFNTYLTRPFAQFAVEITRVSQIEVEGIRPYPHNASMLREINVMRTAINTLVANMITYRSFMPSSLHETINQVAPEEELSSEIDSQPSSATLSTVISRSDSSHIHNAEKTLARALINRRVAMALLNLVDFHKEVVSKREASVMMRHEEYLAVCLGAVTQCKGLADTFIGDRVTLSFNAAKVNASYKESAVRCALLACSVARSKIAMNLTASVTSGALLVGHIGTDCMRRFGCLGNAVSWLYAQERYARWQEVTVLTDPSVTETCLASFDFRHHSFVRRVKSPVPTEVFIVSEALKGLEVSENEWMYQIGEANQMSSHSARNSVFLALRDGLWDIAQAALRDLQPLSAEEQALWSMATKNCVEPTEVSHL